VNIQRARTSLEWLTALDLGVLSAALAAFLLRRVSREVAEILLWPKTQVSEWLGNLKGWSPHIKQVDPIGFWIQLAGVTLVLAVIVVAVRRALSARARSQTSLGRFPGVVAVTVPWVFLGLVVDMPVHPTELMHFIALALPLVAVTLGIRACLLIHRGEWEKKRPEIVGGLVACALPVLLVGDVVPFHVRPAFWASIVIGICVFILWTLAIRRYPVGRDDPKQVLAEP
jgi:hypothetical protein